MDEANDYNEDEEGDRESGNLKTEKKKKKNDCGDSEYVLDDFDCESIVTISKFLK